MQEEVEQKTFNIVVSTTKLTARTILNAGRTALQQYQSKLLADKSSGKQSVRMLLRQNRGVSSVEIDKTNIKGFERYAKKYGIDYAIRKDTSEVPPRYLVFFKAPDADAFNAAFKEYSASLLNKAKRPSVLEKLHELVQSATELTGKVRHKEQLAALATEYPEVCCQKAKGEAGGVTYQIRNTALAYPIWVPCQKIIGKSK